MEKLLFWVDAVVIHKLLVSLTGFTLSLPKVAKAPKLTNFLL